MYFHTDYYRIKEKLLEKAQISFWDILQSVLTWFYQQNKVASCKTSSRLSVTPQSPKPHQNFTSFVCFLDLRINVNTVISNNLKPLLPPQIHTCLKTDKIQCSSTNKVGFDPSVTAKRITTARNRTKTEDIKNIQWTRVEGEF